MAAREQHFKLILIYLIIMANMQATYDMIWWILHLVKIIHLASLILLFLSPPNDSQNKMQRNLVVFDFDQD